MKLFIRTIRRVLKVAWIGIISDYTPEMTREARDDGYEKQKVIYNARPLMTKRG